MGAIQYWWPSQLQHHDDDAPVHIKLYLSSFASLREDAQDKVDDLDRGEMDGTIAYPGPRERIAPQAERAAP